MRSSPPDITAIDHVGIAVNDLQQAIAFYGLAFGASVTLEERIASDGVAEALLQVGDSYIQLLSPTSPNSPVARFLARRGEGIHHVAYRVKDCAAALQRAVEAGVTAIDLRPRPGSRETLVAFIDPRSTNGALIELVEEQKGALGGRG